MATVVLLGTLDTKGREYAFLRERLLEQGVDVLVVDAGVGEPVGLWPDVANTELAGDAAELWEAHDRGDAVTAMGEGAARVVKRLHEEGRLDGILALGGSGGSSIAAAAMRELPVGVPKLIVSTVGSGDAFLGGFLAAWKAERAADDCLRQALACGAANTQTVGAAVFDHRDMVRYAGNVEVQEIRPRTARAS